MSEPHSDPRHNARIIAIQKLFERAFADSDLEEGHVTEFSEETLSEINEVSDFDTELSNSLFHGVIDNREQIDQIIEKLAPQWPLEQIAKTDLQILRVAILEGFILKITPERVAIDEAIELAKEFTNEQSRKFVNGVLGNLIQNKELFNL